MADTNLMSMATPPPGDGQPNLLSMVAGSLQPEDKQNLMSVMATPGGPQRLAQHVQSIVSTGQPAAPAPSVPYARPSSKRQTESKNSTVSGEKTNNYDTGTLDEIGDWVRAQPEYQAQKQSADQMQNMLSMSNQGNQNVGWIKPLSALSDSLTGSHLAETAPDPNAKYAMLMKYQDELAKRKSDMMKTIMEGAQKLKTGQMNDAQTSLLQNMAMQGINLGGASTVQSRLAQIPIRAGQDFDKQTAGATKSIESFNRGERMLTDKSVPLTENTLNAIQQDISAGLTGTGNPTDSRIAMDLQPVIQGIIQHAKTKWTGKFDPAKDDLRTQVPEVTDQIGKVLRASRQEFRDNVNRQADQISKTYEASYDAIPNLRETVQQKRAAISNRFPVSQDYNPQGDYRPPQAADPYANMSDADLAALHAKTVKK